MGPVTSYLTAPQRQLPWSIGHLLRCFCSLPLREGQEVAKDSESRVGSIRNANQGQISIEDRDSGTPDVKKVRVVTTVEYELRDD